MSKCIRAQLPILQSLCKSSPSVRRSILKHSDNKLTRAICECCINTLHGKIKLSARQRIRLKKYKKTIRSLAQRRQSLKSKKKQIVQTGGSFLLALLPAAISTVLSLLGR